MKSESGGPDSGDPTVLPIRRGYCHFLRPILPLERMDTPRHFSLKYSHPLWLVSLWLDRYGQGETIDLLRKNNETVTVTARITRAAPPRDEVLAAIRTEGWSAVAGPLDDSIVIQRSPDLESSAVLSRGWIQVQDLTAIQIGGALRPPPGARVLDLCSAPGGKAAQLLESVGPEGRLVAADRSEEKLTTVRENLSRLGSSFTTVVVPEDPAAIDLGQSFTHVLVDAPCSNTGVLARRPEARWRVKQRDLAILAQLQLGLVEAGLRHLEPGGRLLYATCSIEPQENENVIAKVFASHSDLSEVESRLFLPHRTSGDGGFYSLILKGR